MRNLMMSSVLLCLVGLTAPAAAQTGGRVTVQPYAGYGFFGDLPDTNFTLESDLSLGARVGYAFSPQWALFANAQRSTPSDVNVDHWSAGVEFSYVPRGGAEGMLPILLEAGLGQARYENGPSDFAVNLGIASALQLTPNFAIRYGANDYISNYDGDRGVVNQIFVQVGAELRF